MVSVRRAAPVRRSDQVIVKFAVVSDAGLHERRIRQVGGVSARRSAFGSWYKVTLEPGISMGQALADFRAMPEVEYAEPNGATWAAFSPDDEFFSDQWNFRLLNVTRMWDIQKGDPSVVVAIVDTGIAYEDFGPFRKGPDWGNTVFVEGFNVLTGTSHANDDNFHGTHVAGTVAEGTDNRIAVAGMAFRCALMPVKVLDADGTGTDFDLAEGIRFASQHGAKVINLSLGGDASETVRAAVDDAFRAGAVLVAAAGNESVGTVSFPAAYPNVIAVGAIDGSKQLAFYSNFGSALDVVAPGGDLDRDDDGDGQPDGVEQVTLDPDASAAGRYDEFVLLFVIGTSEATPHVSALAALLVRQGITDPAAVKAAIESTAEDLGTPGRDDRFGFGLIRPVEALKGLGLNQ